MQEVPVSLEDLRISQNAPDVQVGQRGTDGAFLSRILGDPLVMLRNIHREWKASQGEVGTVVCEYVEKLSGDVTRAVIADRYPFLDKDERTIPTEYREGDLTPYLLSTSVNDPTVEDHVTSMKSELTSLYYRVEGRSQVLKIVILQNPVIQEDSLRVESGDTRLGLASFAFDEFIVEGLASLYLPTVLSEAALPSLLVQYSQPVPGALCTDLERAPVLSGFLMEDVVDALVPPPPSILVPHQGLTEKRMVVNPTGLISIFFQISSALLTLQERVRFRHRRLYAHNVRLDPTPTTFRAYGYELQSSFTCKIGDLSSSSFYLNTTQGPILVSRYKYLERSNIDSTTYQDTLPLPRSIPLGPTFYQYSDLDSQTARFGQLGASLDFYTFIVSLLIDRSYYHGTLISLASWWYGLFQNERERLILEDRLKRLDRNLAPGTNPSPSQVSSLLSKIHLRSDVLEYTMQMMIT